MLRRAPAPSPAPAQPRVGRRYLGLDGREWIVVGLSAALGVAAGVFLHYVDSLATDIAYLADLVRAVVYVVCFVIFMIGVGQLSTGRRGLLLAVIPFAVAAVIASGFGPTAVPPVDVAGRIELAVDGAPADAGAAVCTWAAGHEKVERIINTGILPEGRSYTLDVDRGRLSVVLEVDGGRYVALGGEVFATVDDAGQRATLQVPLLQTLPSAPTEIPGAVDARIDWSCEAVPAS